MSMIRALQLLGDRQVALVDRDAPPAPAATRSSFASAPWA